MNCMNDMTQNNALPNPKEGDTVVAADNHVSSDKYFHPYLIVHILYWEELIIKDDILRSTHFSGQIIWI